MSIPEFFTAPLITTYIYLTNTGTKILSSLLCRFFRAALANLSRVRAQKFTLPSPSNSVKSLSAYILNFAANTKTAAISVDRRRNDSCRYFPIASERLKATLLPHFSGSSKMGECADSSNAIHFLKGASSASYHLRTIAVGVL